jgi:hypothetical protein
MRQPVDANGNIVGIGDLSMPQEIKYFLFPMQQQIQLK